MCVYQFRHLGFAWAYTGECQPAIWQPIILKDHSILVKTK